MAGTKKASANNAAQTTPSVVVMPQSAQAPAQQTSAATSDQASVPAAPAPPRAAPPSPNSQNPAANAAVSEDSEGTISWTASEFVAHQKTPGWYGLLALVAIIISALVFLTTRDIISTSVVLVAALFFAIYAARQPRQLQYKLGDSGVSIGEKYYGYEEFRSFALVPEGAFSSIVFMPMKRFAPLRTIYYAPTDEHRIVERLIDCLPFEEHQGDMVDGLMRRIRF